MTLRSQILQWVWKWLPDECEVRDCCRKGMRGNENIIYPFKDDEMFKDFYIIMCDYCSMRYNRGEVLNVSGTLPKMLVNPKKVVSFETRRKQRRQK